MPHIKPVLFLRHIQVFSLAEIKVIISSYGEKVYNLQQEIYGLEIVRSKEYERCMPQLPEEEWQDYVR